MTLAIHRSHPKSLLRTLCVAFAVALVWLALFQLVIAALADSTPSTTNASFVVPANVPPTSPIGFDGGVFSSAKATAFVWLFLIFQQLSKLAMTIHTPNPALANAPGWYRVAHYFVDAMGRVKLDQLFGIPEVTPAPPAPLVLAKPPGSAAFARFPVMFAIAGMIAAIAGGMLISGCATKITQGQATAIEAVTDDVVQALIVGFNDLQAVKNMPPGDVAAANASIAAYNAIKADIATATQNYFASLGTNNPTGTLGGLTLALARPNAQLLTAAQGVKAAILAAEAAATPKQ